MEAYLCKTQPMTDESAGKRKKRYVDRSTSESKTCLIHGHGNYSDECKVLGYIGTKYYNGNHNKDHRNNPVPRKHLTDSNK